MIDGSIRIDNRSRHSSITSLNKSPQFPIRLSPTVFLASNGVKIPTRIYHSHILCVPITQHSFRDIHGSCISTMPNAFYLVLEGD